MGIFGWSYPPGCSGPPDDYERPCEVCGVWSDNCECPECPECGEAGNPSCYNKHGMIMSERQVELRAEMDRRAAADAEAEKTCAESIKSECSSGDFEQHIGRLSRDGEKWMYAPLTDEESAAADEGDDSDGEPL